MQACIYSGYFDVEEKDDVNKKFFMVCAITNQENNNQVEVEGERMMELARNGIKQQGYHIIQTNIEDIQKHTHKKNIEMTDSYKFYFNTKKGPVEREVRNLRSLLLLN